MQLSDGGSIAPGIRLRRFLIDIWKILVERASMRCFMVILPLFIGLLFAPLAVAGDLVISRAALEDATGTLSIADVAGRAFTPSGPTLSKGFKDSVHWLRLRV